MNPAYSNPRALLPCLTSSRSNHCSYSAFRAIGLEKRSGEKMAVDEAMFKSFDTVRR